MEGMKLSKRYRITRAMSHSGKTDAAISLEEAKTYFATQADFTYTSQYTIKGPTTVSIEGDFFMWTNGSKQIPFRHFQGDLYVSGTDEAVVPRMQEIARAFDADIMEG